MASLVVTLLAWITAATGYPMPAASPSVEFVAPQVIRDTMCGGDSCTVGAMYRRGGATVSIDDRLDPGRNLYDAALLLHELVHYVQEQSGRFPGTDCRTWLAQEREAYTLQARWLREHHKRYPLRRALPREDACDQVHDAAP